MHELAERLYVRPLDSLADFVALASDSAAHTRVFQAQIAPAISAPPGAHFRVATTPLCRRLRLLPSSLRGLSSDSRSVAGLLARTLSVSGGTIPLMWMKYFTPLASLTAARDQFSPSIRFLRRI